MPSMREINKLGRANYTLGKFLFLNQLETPGISYDEIVEITQNLKKLEELNSEREKTARRYYIRKIGLGLVEVGSLALGVVVGSKITSVLFKK